MKKPIWTVRMRKTGEMKYWIHKEASRATLKSVADDPGAIFIGRSVDDCMKFIEDRYQTRTRLMLENLAELRHIVAIYAKEGED